MRATLAAGAATIAIAGCGGSRPPRSGPYAPEDPRLVPRIAEEVWYRAVASCGQGPYELELPLEDARWGEELELRLATPRRIALHTVVIADDEEVAKRAAVYDGGGARDGKPDNVRCVADLRERIAVHRGGTTPGAPATPGRPVVPGVAVRDPEPPPPPPAGTAQLELDGGAPPDGAFALVHHGWRDRGLEGETRRIRRIRFRLWSIEPNDLDGVRFGIRRVVWRPTTSDADYEGFLVRRRAELEAARARAQAELERRAAEEAAERARRRAENERRAALRAERLRRLPPEPPPPPPSARVLEENRREREAELARYRRAEEEKRRRAAELLAAEEQRREQRRRREAFCAAHPRDTGCWGAGGLAAHLELEGREGERARYCATHLDDARCWSADERARRVRIWHRRAQVASVPPKQPDGPPPAPLAETQPPKLSVHAEWRPGYWQWTGEKWAWLAGMWRVPEADIVAEQTTTAPEAPPPPREEPMPPPPMATTIWVAGFWQWSGTAWVWVPGSWQARPDAGAGWRPAEWRARGRVHVLIPGGWIRVRAGGRR